MQLQLKNIRAYDKQVYGCQKHGKQVMISFMFEGDDKYVHDLFLTQEMAEYLLKELTTVVDRNKFLTIAENGV